MSEQPERPVWQLATQLVHAGERANASQAKPTTTPIHTATTYLYPNLAALDTAFAEGTGFLYTRYGNPSVAALEAALTAAEGARGAVAYASGMAALHGALLAACTPRGELTPRPARILAARDLYGSTMVLLDEILAPLGATLVYADLCDLDAAAAALNQYQPQVMLIESLSNPLLRVADVAALANLARPLGTRLIVDATLTTPVLQRPLSLGADLVVHSATKYLSGHGDVAGGIVAARTGMLHATLVRQARLLGASLGPFEAQQIQRGLKTLALRIERQCANAVQVAQFLDQHPAVTQVYYPGLPTHPQHTLAAQTFGGYFGGMVSCELRGGAAAVAPFVDRLQIFLPATTLGDLYSLVSVPVIASHRELSPTQRAERGISASLVRLSVGIEAASDLVIDLEQALAS